MRYYEGAVRKLEGRKYEAGVMYRGGAEAGYGFVEEYPGGEVFPRMREAAERAAELARERRAHA
jgi:hypothetical protein